MRFRLPLLLLFVAPLLLGSGYSRAQPADGAYKDWQGVRHDLYYLIGWQVVATAIIYNAPFEFSNWSPNEKDQLGFEQWRENFTNPVWDKDHWGVNYVLHPYWGAGYYIRGRERGFSRSESFWISALYSTIYEFGIESFLEEPSIQDIIVTPVAGSLLGLYFENVRNRILSQPRPIPWFDKFKLGLTDPLGALNRGVNRLVGLEYTGSPPLLLSVRPVYALSDQPDTGRTDSPQHLTDEIDGFSLTFEYRW